MGKFGFGFGDSGGGGGGGVTSVSGTANRITSTGGTTPVIDIAATYVGQTSITTLGTIGTGVWNATAIGIAKGGTGQTTANNSLNALLPTQAGSEYKILNTDGTNTSWSDILKDSTGTTSLDFQTRVIKDSADMVVFDYENKIIYSQYGIAFDINNLILSDGTQDLISLLACQLRDNTGGIATVRWAECSLRDLSSQNSIEWGARELWDELGSIACSWSSTGFNSTAYKVGGVAGDDATVVIPAVGTLTFTKGILTNFT